MMKVTIFSILFVLMVFNSTAEESKQANDRVLIEFALPVLEVDPYHRPYVAIWIETANREAVKTLAVWSEKDTWLKDMRQWWRKVGRIKKEDLDGVSGATHKPGQYRIAWDGLNYLGKAVAPGEYLLNIESVREEGGRSYLRQKISLDQSQSAKEFTLPADAEIGPIKVIVK